MKSIQTYKQLYMCGSYSSLSTWLFLELTEIQAAEYTVRFFFFLFQSYEVEILTFKTDFFFLGGKMKL